MMRATSRDRIRTLRVIGRPPDPLAARRAVERALATVEMRTDGLPADAIVCVRHVRVPAPDGDARRWRAALERSVRARLASGAHPFTESVPEHAGIVIFENAARMLACLLRDWRRGRGNAWWWQSLFGAVAEASLVQRTLAESPMYVPAALAMLTGDEAVDVVSALPPGDCEHLGVVIARTFAVPGWPGEAAPAATAGALAESVPRAECRISGPAASAVRAITRMLDRTALAPPQRALLGMSLLLCAAPSVARMPEVIERLRAGDALVGAADSPSPVLETRAAPVRAGETSSPAPGPSVRARRRALVRGEVASSRESHDTLVADRVSSSDGDGRDSAGATSDRLPAGAHDGPPVQAHLATAAPEPLRPIDARCRIESRAAGVVYLVNLAIHLGLYADFTAPATPGLELPLADFLTLVGARACGDDFCDDPMWTLLAMLAGRAPTEPPSRAGAPAGESFEDWLDRVTGRLEARAARSLGTPAGESLAFLCRQQGRLELSATRLDVIFALAAHPLSIRVAGLDRNPGWVPSAGRIIELHYE